jgi:hypothetical protein
MNEFVSSFRSEAPSEVDQRTEVDFGEGEMPARLQRIFQDPSEPIYTEPSLFERSRSLRSVAASDFGRVLRISEQPASETETERAVLWDRLLDNIFFHSFLGFLSLLWKFLFIRENQQIPKDEAVLHYLHMHSCSTEYSFFVNITTDIMIAMFQTNKSRVMVLIFLAPRNDKQKK